MREQSGSHGSRGYSPQAVHPGCPGGLAQVGRSTNPQPRHRSPPGFRCGLLRSKLPTSLVRTLSTMRPCAQVSVTAALPPAALRHGGTRLDEVGRVPGVKRSGTGGVARQGDKFPGKEMIP